MQKRRYNRRHIITRVPDDTLTLDVFTFEKVEIPAPSEGELLVRSRVLSIDAANRAWLQGTTYRSAIGEGAVMPGLAIAEVIESRAEGYHVGDIVFGDIGWQDYAVMSPDKLERQESVDQLSHLLSLYGTSSLTAYFGLTEIGQIANGETLVVSAAAGSVGIAVGQIGRALGARTIGIAGGRAKCEWLVETVGFDASLDYKRDDFKERLRAATPDGIDVVFDNVGGDILDTCLFAMARRGRIVCCGAVGSYDGEKPKQGPRGVPGLLITRELSMRGFIVDSFSELYGEARTKLHEWVRSGKLLPFEDVYEGLEMAPAALVDLLAGGNRGKRIVSL